MQHCVPVIQLLATRRPARLFEGEEERRCLLFKFAAREIGGLARQNFLREEFSIRGGVNFPTSGKTGQTWGTRCGWSSAAITTRVPCTERRRWGCRSRARSL